MPKQVSLIKIEGSMEGLNFYRRKGGFMARKRTSVTKERIETDPAFERTRETNSEFSRAAKAGKLLRRSISGLLKNLKTGDAVNRLFTEMFKVLRSDAVNGRGKREVANGSIDLLSGFEFNSGTPLDQTLTATYTYVIERVSGKCAITLQPFSPAVKINAPRTADNFTLVSAAVELDFATNQFVLAASESATLPLGNAEVNIPVLLNNLPADSTKPIFLVLGIVFGQEVNGFNYPLKDKSFNALKLISINAP